MSWNLQSNWERRSEKLLPLPPILYSVHQASSVQVACIYVYVGIQQAVWFLIDILSINSSFQFSFIAPWYRAISFALFLTEYCRYVLCTISSLGGLISSHTIQRSCITLGTRLFSCVKGSVFPFHQPKTKATSCFLQTFQKNFWENKKTVKHRKHCFTDKFSSSRRYDW